MSVYYFKLLEPKCKDKELICPDGTCATICDNKPTCNDGMDETECKNKG